MFLLLNLSFRSQYNVTTGQGLLFLYFIMLVYVPCRLLLQTHLVLFSQVPLNNMFGYATAIRSVTQVNILIKF